MDAVLQIGCASHYDLLIDENNDPVYDPPAAKAYMDKWDGQLFVDELRLSPEKDVLEIGVGTGRLAVRVCGGCKSFTGIDISPKTAERAKENLRDFPNARLICGDFLTFPFDRKFNVIYSSLTFMHIKDKRAAIKKNAGLLCEAGRFVLSTDKNQATELDMGSRRIKIYPDTPRETAAALAAVIFTAKKDA